MPKHTQYVLKRLETSHLIPLTHPIQNSFTQKHPLRLRTLLGENDGTERLCCPLQCRLVVVQPDPLPLKELITVGVCGARAGQTVLKAGQERAADQGADGRLGAGQKRLQSRVPAEHFVSQQQT